MGHSNEVKFAVVNAKNFVTLEIQTLNVTVDLLVLRRIPKAQIPVVSGQRQQMRGNPRAVISA